MKAASRRRSDQAAAGSRVLPVGEVTGAAAVATATVTRELDSARAAELARELRRVAASRPQKLVLDLHGAVLVNLAERGVDGRPARGSRKPMRAGVPVLTPLLRTPLARYQGR